MSTNLPHISLTFFYEGSDFFDGIFKLAILTTFCFRSDQKFFNFAQINFTNRNRRLYQCTQCGDHNHGNLVKLKRHITSRHTKVMIKSVKRCFRNRYLITTKVSMFDTSIAE